MMKQHKTMGRREFLRIIGVGGIAGVAAVTLDRINIPEQAVITETRLLMGTVVNLALVTDDRQTGQRAVKASLDRMAALEAILSRHQQTSQITQLNREGYLAHPSDALVHLLRESQHLSRLSAGAFDVTVKPLLDLYHASQTTAGRLPSEDEVQRVLARVGYQHLQITDEVIRFAVPEMAITLDGIAKGFIVDEGARILEDFGFHDILVEAGGDLVASGTNPLGKRWRIGIQGPRAEHEHLIHSFQMSNRSAATSGDYVQHYADDLSRHHIIDPRTGVSAPELASVTVTAPNGMQADALATALMVMGSGAGLALIEGLTGCEAYLVTKDLQSRQSSGWV